MKAKHKLIALLNKYLRVREMAKIYKAQQEETRDTIIALLPPNTTHEWTFDGWGRVTHQPPKNTVSVDVAKLLKYFPAAYDACVSSYPSEPRFCVYPIKQAYASAFAEIRGKGEHEIKAELTPN